MVALACGSGRRKHRQVASEHGWPSVRAGNRSPARFPPPRRRLAPDSRVSMRRSPHPEAAAWDPATSPHDPGQVMVRKDRPRAQASHAHRAAMSAGQAVRVRSTALAARVTGNSSRQATPGGVPVPMSPLRGSAPRSRPPRRGSGLLLTSCHPRIALAESVASKMNCPSSARHGDRTGGGVDTVATKRGVSHRDSAFGPCVEGAATARTRRITRHRTGRSRRRRSPLHRLQRQAGDENGHPSVIILERPLPCRPWTRSNASPPFTAS